MLSLGGQGPIILFVITKNTYLLLLTPLLFSGNHGGIQAPTPPSFLPSFLPLSSSPLLLSLGCKISTTTLSSSALLRSQMLGTIGAGYLLRLSSSPLQHNSTSVSVPLHLL